MDEAQDPNSELSVNVNTALDFIGSNVTTEPEREREKYVDDTTAFYFKILVYCALCSLISTVGLVTNIINIIVFLKQGIFAESNALCLFALSVSDLLCVASMLWLSIGFAITLAELTGLTWDPFGVTYVTAAWPHLMFAQITRMVTAYVAFERCMCVVFPFQVRTWFTPKRSMAIIVCIFMYCLIAYFPLLTSQQLRYQTDPDTNVTKLVMAFTELRHKAMGVTFEMSTGVNIGSVGIVLLCTMITVSRVNLSRAWRESATKAATVPGEETQDKPKKQKQISNMGKERKVVKMITTISLIFLLCYAPDFIFFITHMINPDIQTFGIYENLAYVMYSFTYLTETINSSINIFVYYSMSSRYKQEMNSLLCKSVTRTI